MLWILVTTSMLCSYRALSNECMWVEQAVLVQMSEGKFTSLGALGAGLLTGTALAVILPEGFHAFQAAQDATGEHPVFSSLRWHMLLPRQP